ncbi:MAG: citryl-CoA lyase [Desulfuromonas sp.]|nr:MAG: citryl-CoA lyase [Desulfuromonas sp.]
MVNNADKDPRVSDWWQTEIVEMAPGMIRFRGYPIEELIGNVGFAQMIWLMLRGELPAPEQAGLLEAALMSAVDHGPQAPSIAVARMAASCGIGLNNAMASAVNVLGDVHGGAGEQAVDLYTRIAAECDEGHSLAQATADVVAQEMTAGNPFIPGFGHRFHPIDPRSPRLLELVDEAAAAGVVSGRYAAIGREIETTLARRKGKRIPMNIDGATAVIYAELGFPAPLARGLFCLSRSVGILAHAWEQSQDTARNKGPMPKDYLWAYKGKKLRHLDSGGD